MSRLMGDVHDYQPINGLYMVELQLFGALLMVCLQFSSTSGLSIVDGVVIGDLYCAVCLASMLQCVDLSILCQPNHSTKRQRCCHTLQ